ncbi:MAG: tRNA 4-thiouridine(8) synthase ThiI [Lachnospiraceae bacterium]|nr:tRNA 4-thiouridine(8) synthase ThiI [Lachnospiraceae bacterium]
METNSFLIKYAEIGVKGKNRYKFEDALVKRIRQVLYGLTGNFEVYKSQGRIMVDASGFDQDEVVAALKKVFGIVGICPVKVFEVSDYDTLKSDVVSYMKDKYEGKSFTFKVKTRRIDKNFPRTSPAINMDLGELILKALPTLSVDVHEPQVEVFVEIRDKIYVYSEIIPGPGGMPSGTAGKAMLLLSGGIDSPVAGYMIGKRGVDLEAVYFHAPPYTSDRAKQKVVDLAAIVAQYTGRIKLHVINFTDIQMYIYETCPHDQLTIIMRRYMMRIAQKLAEDGGCLGLITGESIAQVASQTMHSLMATNAVCTIPVYRPCIGMDKQEIIDRSQQIGSYETSILPYEDCCTIFVAKHPVTKPSVAAMEKSEKRLAERIDELVATALETDEIIEVG